MGKPHGPRLRRSLTPRTSQISRPTDNTIRYHDGSFRRHLESVQSALRIVFAKNILGANFNVDSSPQSHMFRPHGQASTARNPNFPAHRPRLHMSVGGHRDPAVCVCAGRRIRHSTTVLDNAADAANASQMLICICRWAGGGVGILGAHHHDPHTVSSAVHLAVIITATTGCPIEHLNQPCHTRVDVVAGQITRGHEPPSIEYTVWPRT
jgi:hypothetical protein